MSVLIVIVLIMGYLSSIFSLDMLKEMPPAGPFSRRAWTHTAYEEAKRIATYAGPELS